MFKVLSQVTRDFTEEENKNQSIEKNNEVLVLKSFKISFKTRFKVLKRFETFWSQHRGKCSTTIVFNIGCF